MEMGPPGVGTQQLQHPVHRDHELVPEQFEREVPLTIPMCVGNDVDPGH
jgi:hypothetical protein